MVYRSRPVQPQQQSVRRKPQTKTKLVKLIAGFAVLLLLIIILAVSCDSEKTRNGIDIITAMAGQIPTMHSVVDHTAESDPNGSLGQEGWYINKIDWNDSRTDEGTYTLEVYSETKEAKERAAYLESFYGSILSDYVVYRVDCYVLRVSNDLSEQEIQNYQDVFDYLIGANEKDFSSAFALGTSHIAASREVEQKDNTYTEQSLNSASLQPTVETTQAPSLFPQTIFDMNGVKIIISSFDKYGTIGPEIKLTVENNSNTKLRILTGELYCDGWQLKDFTTLIELDSGTKTGETIYIYDSELEDCGLLLYQIKEVTFKNAEIRNPNNYSQSYTFDMKATLQY